LRKKIELFRSGDFRPAECFWLVPRAQWVTSTGARATPRYVQHTHSQSAVLSLLARVRHTNALVIADRGFRAGRGSKQMDLSLTDNVPTVLQVLGALRRISGSRTRIWRANSGRPTIRRRACSSARALARGRAF
jgi:hypothetical protein